MFDEGENAKMEITEGDYEYWENRILPLLKGAKEKLNSIEFGLLYISISSKLKKLKQDKKFESKH